MAKKRVHEIAKDLKIHGIEMDNKELISELQDLDFDVKSHSSSLDEDQAAVAIEKIMQKRKPKAAAMPVHAAGFVVRRRRPEATATVPSPAETVVSQPTETVPAEVKAAAEVARDASKETSSTSAIPKVAVSEPEKKPEMIEVAEGGNVSSNNAGATGAFSLSSDNVTIEPVSVPKPIKKPEEALASTTTDSAVSGKPTVTPATPSTSSSTKQEASPRPAKSIKPSGPSLPRVVSREVSDANLSRPSRSARPTPSSRQGSGQPRPPVDPRSQRPTATQAVVLSRPSVPVRRVTPPSDAHKRVPLAPGPRAIGEVRELKVGTDFMGRREFTDVTKDHSAKKRGKQEIKENLTKQELIDLARGRVTLPLRVGKKKKPTKKGAKTQITEMAEEKKVIKIDETISVSELSRTIGIKAVDLIKKLMASGQMVTVNSSLDSDTAAILAADYGWRVEKKGFGIENYLPESDSRPDDMKTRPPVVTIMGHVDHGKTSLLDAIRKADVVGGEAGGITQHIGAYSVMTSEGKAVTFLDTPGHEAFTAMRARGAKVTDIVVIVVAADDGVMPQTREAVNHAKAAEVPILVAINKIDKPGANLQTVKNQLMEFGLVDEQFGGDTIMVPVSAKTQEGLPHLLEMILLQAEVLELKANPNRAAKCTVVEAKLEKGRGPVATVIVREGTLKAGDPIVTGTQFGKVRAMTNDHGEKVESVLPGFPVEVIGLSGVPTAGDEFWVLDSENSAKEVALHRSQKDREKELAKSAKVKLEDFFSRVEKGEAKELKLIVKADVQGSVEAVVDSLQKLSSTKVKVKVIDFGVGGVKESDVMLAAASDALIVGFNVRPESKTSEVAQQHGVEIRMYQIIYQAVDEVRKAMEGLLEPTRREKTLGRAEVRNLFSVPKLGTIAGCAVIDGKIARSAMVRLLRDNKQVFVGKIGSLRRFKDDVREVASGFECGLSIENYSDIKQGDVVEAYEIEEVRQSL